MCFSYVKIVAISYLNLYSFLQEMSSNRVIIMGSRAILCQQLLKSSSEHFCRPSYCVSSIIQQLNMSMYQPQITVRNIKQHEDNALHNRLKSLERCYLFHSLRYYAKSRDKKKGDKGTVIAVETFHFQFVHIYWINMQNMLTSYS